MSIEATRIWPQPFSISVLMDVPYTYSRKPDHLIAEAHYMYVVVSTLIYRSLTQLQNGNLTIGQLSAFVYRVKSANADWAADGLSRNRPCGSVKTAVQFLIAAISPEKYH